MDQLLICPWCESKYPNIAGWIFPIGDPQGHKCNHQFHLGTGYNPSVLALTDSDREFLAALKVRV